MSAPAEPESLDAVIVGGGFNGCYLLHRLREEGYAVRLVEAEPRLGGVWQANRYPGARVDSHVPNYEFSMEEIWRDWIWSEKFPGRDELVAYFEHIDDVLDLGRDVDLGTRITSAHVSTDDDRWTLGTDVGRRYGCRYLLLCLGFGSARYVPDLPGLGSFTGPCHHTARWPEDGVDLAGRRVGVVGTGASGVQVVQEAAKVAGHLTVFQRTPVTAIPMRQERLDPDAQRAAKADLPEIFARRNAPPGSFHDLQREDVGAMAVSAERRREVLEAAWQRGGFHFWFGTFNDVLMDEAANRTVYDFWRDRTRERVDDPVTAELLAPDEPPYPFGTKRPSLEQDYYDQFNRPNVDLVDLRTTPIEAITPTGIRTSGTHIELDVIVLATGFDANTGGMTTLDLPDLDGVQLADRWADGADTHLGVAVPGFPNLLMLYGPQSAASFCNGPVCAELQGEWVVELLDHVRAGGHSRFDSSPDAARWWTGQLAEVAERTLFGRTASWYMGANVPGKRRQLLNHPSSDVYLGELRACAAAGYRGFLFG
ncbi:MAG: NAD(P)/FAD-dependent oxidoreductase [Actinomycetota bacterium]